MAELKEGWDYGGWNKPDNKRKIKWRIIIGLIMISLAVLICLKPESLSYLVYVVPILILSFVILALMGGS